MARIERWSGVLVPTVATTIAGTQPGTTGRYFIDFGIRADRLTTLSFADVLNGSFDPSMLAGKTVMIGATAVELGDMIAPQMHCAPAPVPTVAAVATAPFGA